MHALSLYFIILLYFTIGIVFAIHLPALFWVSCVSFSPFLRKKELFSACYPLVRYTLKQLLTSVLVKSGRYLPRRYVVQQLSTTIYFHFGE